MKATFKGLSGSCPRLLEAVYKFSVFGPPDVDVFEDPWKILDSFVMLQQPGGSLWCWAAVVSSVVLFIQKTEVCQCAVAEKVLGSSFDCCSNIDPRNCENASTIVPKSCNSAKRLEIGLAKYSLFRCCTVGAPNFEVVRAEIDGGRPVLFRESTAHFVAVTGYERRGNSVQVKDPQFGNTMIPAVYSSFAKDCSHAYFVL
jgi:hypothetical protein